MVAGAWRKRDGQLVDVDRARVLRLATSLAITCSRRSARDRIGGDWMPRA